MEQQTTNNIVNNQLSTNLLKFTGLVILFVMVFCSGIIIGRLINSSIIPFGLSSGLAIGNSTASKNANIDLFWQVWNTMEQNYVDSSKTDENKMMYGAIEGMVSSYGDAATIFLDPTQTDDYNKQNEGKYFEGIGAELGYKDGAIIVVAPIDGSPAKAAGIRAGDIILKVDDIEIKSTDNVYEIVAKIRGKAGTVVKLSVLHSGDSEITKLEITRGEITIPSIEVRKPSYYGTQYSKYDSEIAVLSVSRFTEASLPEWKSKWDLAVSQIKSTGVKYLIIDLRNNPGGFFDAAIYAAGEFLPDDKLVAQQKDKDGNTENFNVNRIGKLLDMPVVILVNEGSASASEIFAGGLKQNDRAKVIGTKTYGKGTAQTILPLDGGSSLHITILKWLLPDGTWLNHDNPISPDIEVEKTSDDFKNGLDPQLSKGLEIVKN